MNGCSGLGMAPDFNSYFPVHFLLGAQALINSLGSSNQNWEEIKTTSSLFKEDGQEQKGQNTAITPFSMFAYISKEQCLYMSTKHPNHTLSLIKHKSLLQLFFFPLLLCQQN